MPALRRGTMLSMPALRRGTMLSMPALRRGTMLRMPALRRGTMLTDHKITYVIRGVSKRMSATVGLNSSL